MNKLQTKLFISLAASLSSSVLAATDCDVLSEWLPDLFPKFCCDDIVTTCNYKENEVMRIRELGLGYQHGVSKFEKQSGVITAKISLLTELECLDLSNNKFTGEIPKTIKELPELAIVRLNGNDFTGEIPPAICHLDKLSELNLRANSLEGDVPKCFSILRYLKKIFLSDNHLTGMMPLIEDILVVDIVNNNGLEPWVAPIKDQPTTSIGQKQTSEARSSATMILIISLSVFLLLCAIILGVVIVIVKRRSKTKAEPDYGPSSSFTASEAYPMDDFDDMGGSNCGGQKRTSNGEYSRSSTRSTVGGGANRRIEWGIKLSSGTVPICLINRCVWGGLERKV
jgi:hypothetical protein